MRAVAVSGPGGPEVLRIEERPVPVAAAGEVVIATAFAGINRHDCNQRRRGHPPAGATDILGLEVSGRIVAVGAGVAQSRVGEAVCALVNGGGYAEACIADAQLALPLPDGASLHDAAALPEACFTAWFNVMQLGRLAPGEWLLIHGGTSGVGTIALQIAAALGAKVMVTAGTAEKCQAAQQLGAARAVNYKDEDFLAIARDLTGGRGVDVILDMVGGLYAKKNVDALAPDGRLVHISGAQEPLFAVPLQTIMQKRLSVSGSLLRPLPLARKSVIAQELLAQVWPRIGRDISPVVDTVFPLDEVADAHAYMEAGRNIGKILLRVNPDAAAGRG